MKVYPVEPKRKVELELLSQVILHDFDPTFLIKPQALAVEKLIDTFMYERYNWSLHVRDDLPPDILGLADPKSKTIGLPEETYEGIISGEGRPRFTACHEFSHVVLHKDQMQARMVSIDQSTENLYRIEKSSLKAYVNPEWQADYFAGALLMPVRSVLKLKEYYSGERLIQEMMAVFKVSRSAAEVRLDKLRK